MTSSPPAPTIPYPHRQMPRCYNGMASTHVTLPGGIEVALSPTYPRGHWEADLRWGKGTSVVPDLPMPAPADRHVEVSILNTPMHPARRTMSQAIELLHRLKDLPPAILPRMPSDTAIAERTFPDQSPSRLTAAQWHAVTLARRTLIADVIEPAERTYQQRRKAIWAATLIF